MIKDTDNRQTKLKTISLKPRFSPNAQLSLGLEGNHHSNLSDFYPGDQNRVVITLIRRLLGKTSDKHLGIHGPTQVGKTHLLTGACMAAQDSGVPSGYLPMADIVDQMPATILEGLDYLGLICLDDLHAICGREDWEQALLALCVRVQARAGRVLMSANQDLNHLPWRISAFLAYLISGCLIFPCYPLKESEKQTLVEEHAMLTGLLMPPVVSKFLVKQYGDNTTGLLQSIHRIKEHTVGLKRKLTVPQVKDILALV